MSNQLKLKNKLILLLLLSALLGAVSLLPDLRAKNNLAQNPTPQNDNKSGVNCDNNYESDISIVTQSQKKTATDSCLFIGCSGFIF